ncbi:uncharacterized protein LOC111673876 [Orussus abietinus]|uniref:uncharacterized protein LOC111673876 n=1 Tax=Orussus abietinus TaxID=222816 RepID=UPI000C715C6D|nr:uncharacterized protein LOC111673876 [Orussus abietinus]
MSEPAAKIDINGKHDCMSCRIISGCVLVGAGFFVLRESKKSKNISGKAVMSSLATALVVLGTASVFNLSPFQNQR